MDEDPGLPQTTPMIQLSALGLSYVYYDFPCYVVMLSHTRTSVLASAPPVIVSLSCINFMLINNAVFCMYLYTEQILFVY